MAGASLSVCGGFARPCIVGGAASSTPSSSRASVEGPAVLFHPACSHGGSATTPPSCLSSLEDSTLVAVVPSPSVAGLTCSGLRGELGAPLSSAAGGYAPSHVVYGEGVPP